MGGPLATIGLDMMLDTAGYGSIRRLLAEQEDTLVCYPLSEFAGVGGMTGAQMRNIKEDRNHGTYTGTMFGASAVLDPCQTIDIPEGHTGMSFIGGYGEVPDDSALGLTNNLSLTGGGFNIWGFIIPGASDATRRCIVAKQSGAPTTTNGWHIAQKDGKLNGFLRVAGVTIFDLASSTLSGDLQFFGFGYDLTRAWWRLDGLADTSVGSVTTEPAVTTANLRIGLFNDASGPLNTTTLAYVTISRLGDETIDPIVQAMRSWTDKSTSIRRAGGFRMRYGIPGTSPIDRVGGTGTLQCRLDNRSSSDGAFSPHHPNVTSGFDLGIPVRGRITYSSYSKYFRGKVKSVKPAAGQYRSRDVEITAIDYMNVLAETSVTRVAAHTDIAASDAAALIIQEAPMAPAACEPTPITPTLPYAFDNSKSESMKAMTELQRIHQTDFGATYISNQSPGGRLFVLNRTVIEAKTVSATFDNTMHDFEFTYDVESMINTVRASVNQRQTPGGTVTLFTAPVPFTLEQRETIELEFPYINPNASKRRVGSLTLTPLVASTDYTMERTSDATDLTSSLVVTATFGGNVTKVSLYNNSGHDGRVTLLQGRGVVTSVDQPSVVVEHDQPSEKRYGAREFSLDLPYQDDIDEGQHAAQFVLATRSGPTPAAKMRFLADQSATLMQQALEREPFDVISVRETMTSGTTYRQYYIMNIALDVDGNGFTWCEWLLAPVHQLGSFWLFGASGSSNFGVTTELGWGF
jgi:hypothetical protein